MFMLSIYLIPLTIILFLLFLLLGAERRSIVPYILMTYASVIILFVAAGAGILWTMFTTPMVHYPEVQRMLENSLDLSRFIEFERTLNYQIQYTDGPWVILKAPYIVLMCIFETWFNLLMNFTGVVFITLQLMGFLACYSCWQITLSIFPWKVTPFYRPNDF